MILLTDEERQKFALWLRQEIAIDNQFAEQLAKMPGSGMAGMAGLAKMRRQEVVAKTIVAQLLEIIETETIEP